MTKIMMDSRRESRMKGVRWKEFAIRIVSNTSNPWYQMTVITNCSLWKSAKGAICSTMSGGGRG